jgi:quinolinate synthase
MSNPKSAIINESERLRKKLRHVGWSHSDCNLIAPLTLQINEVKKKKNAIILAHSYQTPDIMYGVADFLGDSYGLSMVAKETDADTIVFCSVHFMGETAKILNPEKQVVVPAIAGCSLAESITPTDIRNLRKQYPNAGVVCYVNTSAEVKAECDACCTSANVLKVIEGMPQKEIIFVPDEYMAKNTQPLTQKKIIGWKGRCIVHEEFSPESVKEIRERFPEAKILAHTECSPAVIEGVDMAGSTTQMMDYVKNSDDDQFMIVTECGLTDRIKSELKEKEIVGTCALCPYMKKIMLKDVLQCLKSPTPEQAINIPEPIMDKARGSLEKMIELTET